MAKHDDLLEGNDRSPDTEQGRARAKLELFFEEKRERVFFYRQVAVQHEKEFFHWVTNRAITYLIQKGQIQTETRALVTGGVIKLLWNRGYRYYKREAKRVVKLVEEYTHPDIGNALNQHGIRMVLDGFARSEFILKGQETDEYRGRKWHETAHYMDMIFARNGQSYGIEVKNTLMYMGYNEFKIKIRLCKELGIRPVFAVRMMPTHWIDDLRQQGGFALILKYQLYPGGLKDLAKRIVEELELPVRTPRRLEDEPMERFIEWHRKNVK